jgi:hypothetical protein
VLRLAQQAEELEQRYAAHPSATGRLAPGSHGSLAAARRVCRSWRAAADRAARTAAILPRAGGCPAAPSQLQRQLTRLGTGFRHLSQLDLSSFSLPGGEAPASLAPAVALLWGSLLPTGLPHLRHLAVSAWLLPAVASTTSRPVGDPGIAACGRPRGARVVTHSCALPCAAGQLAHLRSLAVRWAPRAGELTGRHGCGDGEVHDLDDRIALHPGCLAGLTALTQLQLLGSLAAPAAAAGGPADAAPAQAPTGVGSSRALGSELASMVQLQHLVLGPGELSCEALAALPGEAGAAQAALAPAPPCRSVHPTSCAVSSSIDHPVWSPIQTSAAYACCWIPAVVGSQLHKRMN